MSFVFLLALGIGIVAGLRSLLAPAVIAWAAHFELVESARFARLRSWDQGQLL
jgi:uncharacterized membrane protein